MNILKVVDRREVAARLVAARKALELRQVDAAAQFGKPQAVISQWEAAAEKKDGEGLPAGAVEVTRLGCLLGLSPNELFLEGSDTRLRDKARNLLSPEDAEDADDLIQELWKLTKLAGPGMVALFLDHAAGLRASFAAQLEGREPLPGGSGLALPTREEVVRLKADLLAFATAGFAESPHAQAAVSVAQRLGRVAAVLPRQEAAAGTAAPRGPGRSRAAPAAASPERAAGPRKRASSTPRKKK